MRKIDDASAHSHLANQNITRSAGGDCGGLDQGSSEHLTCLLYKTVMLYLLYDTVYFHAEPVGAKRVSFDKNVIFSVPWKFWQKRIWLFVFLLK